MGHVGAWRRLQDPKDTHTHTHNGTEAIKRKPPAQHGHRMMNAPVRVGAKLNAKQMKHEES